MSRGQVTLGDNYLRKDVGPEKASKYIDAAVDYTVMFAGHAESRVRDEIERLRLIAQPTNQNQTGRQLTEDELEQQRFFIAYREQLADSLEYYKEKDNPLKLFQLYGVSGLMSEAERLPNLLNEPNIKNYIELYGGIAGKDGRMILEIPVFSGEENNVQAILSEGYKPSLVPEFRQSFLHKLLYGGIIHKDQVIQLVGPDGTKMGYPFSKNKRF
tara:strand:- start:566 stop:1207 length:642 start_codon:yes stop_codon:yes gene_type:complete